MVLDMLHGYMNKLAIIDLSNKEIDIAEIDPETACKYVGGRGYAAKLIFDNAPKRVNPLSPENILIIMTGPLTGTPAPSSGRFTVSSKSPLTGTVFDSHCGGNFGPRLKHSGFDGIVLKGSSNDPVYIVLDNGKVEIKDAKSLWGSTTVECHEKLERKYGCDAGILCIGPAGENMVYFSCIVSDKHRVAGRGGLAAVMGSKKVKAIVAKGCKDITVANPYAFMNEVKKLMNVLKRHPVTGYSLERYGTNLLTQLINKAGLYPVRNFQEAFLETVEEISGEEFERRLKVRSKACISCPISCGKISLIKTEKGNIVFEGPEYESVWALGANCGLLDLEKIAYLAYLCDLYGLDTISTGNVIATLMELSEKGIFPKDRLNGKISWGDFKLMSKLIIDIVYQRGVGAELSKGPLYFAKKYNAEEYAMHVKGMGLPAYDPRGAYGQALSYATSNRGGCHLRAYMIMSEILSIPRFLDPRKVEGKAELVKRMQDIFAVIDSMIICKYNTLAVFNTLNYEPDAYARLLTTATGFYIDPDEFTRIGERIYNLERLYNLREGIGPELDTLPKRFIKTPLGKGPAAGSTVPLERLLAEYYRVRGWINGVPSLKKLEELDIPPLVKWPVLQVALDLRSLDDAIRIAEASARGGAQWIEAGTPLIKSEGMKAVRELRRRLPYAVIVADLKTMDTGWMETEIAAQAGADVVCILGAADDNTIKDAVGCGRKYGVKIMVDLINVPEDKLLERAKQIEKLGEDYICIHTGIDVQRDKSEEIDEKIDKIRRIVESVKIPVAAAGGIRVDTCLKLVKAGVKIIIVGGAITRASDPEAATREFIKVMSKV